MGGLATAALGKYPAITTNINIRRAENGWIVSNYGIEIVAKTWNEAVDILKEKFGITE